ncbi:hypothetical protein K439DRAFT_1617430 [Ramaria rubella]|nr:hypothetical protein K439DRAFT_1617430 [Ramaria rubella]
MSAFRRSGMWLVNPLVFNDQDFGPSLHSSMIPPVPSTYPAYVSSSLLSGKSTDATDGDWVPTVSGTSASDKGEDSGSEGGSGPEQSGELTSEVPRIAHAHPPGSPSSRACSPISNGCPTPSAKLPHQDSHTHSMSTDPGGPSASGSGSSHAHSQSASRSTSHGYSMRSVLTSLAQQAFLLPKSTSQASTTSFTSSTSMSEAVRQGLEQKLQHMETALQTRDVQLLEAEILITDLASHLQRSEANEGTANTHAHIMDS